MIATEIMESVPEKEEFVRRCEEVYKKHNASLETRYAGKLVALYENGVAAVDDTIDAVLEKAEKSFPHKVFYVRKIGKNSASAILF